VCFSIPVRVNNNTGGSVFFFYHTFAPFENNDENPVGSDRPSNDDGRLRPLADTNTRQSIISPCPPLALRGYLTTKIRARGILLCPVLDRKRSVPIETYLRNYLRVSPDHLLTNGSSILRKSIQSDDGLRKNSFSNHARLLGETHSTT